MYSSRRELPCHEGHTKPDVDCYLVWFRQYQGQWQVLKRLFLGDPLIFHLISFCQCYNLGNIMLLLRRSFETRVRTSYFVHTNLPVSCLSFQPLQLDLRVTEPLTQSKNI